MKARFLVFLLLGLAGAALAAGDDAPPPNYLELPPGRYSVGLSGMLSTVDSRCIAAEWAKIPEIESAAVDFDKERAVISVRLDRTLEIVTLRRGLRRAERVANMGARFELRRIQYIP